MTSYQLIMAALLIAAVIGVGVMVYVIGDDFLMPTISSCVTDLHR